MASFIQDRVFQPVYQEITLSYIVLNLIYTYGISFVSYFVRKASGWKQFACSKKKENIKAFKSRLEKGNN